MKNRCNDNIILNNAAIGNIALFTFVNSSIVNFIDIEKNF